MSQQRYQGLLAAALCLFCADLFAENRVPAVIKYHCLSPKLQSQESAAINNLAAISNVSAWHNDNLYIEYVENGLTRTYFIGAKSGTNASSIQAMKDVARMAYVSGAPLAYCYTAETSGYRVVFGIGIMGAE